MIRAGDFGNILRGKLPCPAVNQMPHIAGIDKEDFIGAVAELAIGFIAA